MCEYLSCLTREGRLSVKTDDGRNLLYTLLHYLLESWQTAAADIYIKKYFPHLTDSATLLNGMDLNLVHTNFFVDYPRLTAPNTKYVGGMHIKETEGSHLTGEVAEFVKDANQGIILFSLGYTGPAVRPRYTRLLALVFNILGFSPEDVPKDVVDAFVTAFSRVEQKVIMRCSQPSQSYINTIIYEEYT